MLLTAENGEWEVMALVTINDEASSARALRGRDLVVVAPQQRQQAVRLARRHTVLVKGLRVLLPILAVVLLSSYGIFLQRKIEVATNDHVGTIDPGEIRLSLGQPTMRNPSYEGFNQKDGSSYKIRAKRAITDLSETKPIDLFGISGELLQKDGLVTKIVATEGKYNRTSGLLHLFKGIDVRASNGMSARLATADVETKTGIIRSKKPVSVQFPSGSFRGNQMLLKQKQRQVIFSQGVLANLKARGGDKKGTTANSGAARSTTGFAAFAGRSDQPITVVAQSLLVDERKNEAQFSGDVRANQGEAQLTARVLDIAYSGAPADGAAATGSGTLNRLVARENVVITQGADRIVSAVAEFDLRADRALLDGDVVVTSSGGRKVLARRAVINTKLDTVLLTGDVRVVQNDNVLRGGRLLYDQANGTLQLTRPLAEGAGAGRISAAFANPPKPQSAAKPGKSKRAGLFAGQSFQTDPSAPVTVEARRLDADDRRRVAVFQGDVVASQGGFKIQTSELQAKYAGAAATALGSGRPVSSGGAQPGAARLETIYAPNRVAVRSDDGRTAEGDTGRLDLKKNEVELVGNVVLKQGRQVIRGAKLRIDLTTGLTRMETGSGPAVSSVQRGSSDTSRPARFQPKGMADSSNSGACGGRMCAMFFPGELQRLRKKPQKTSPSPPVQLNARGGGPPVAASPAIGSGWSAVTNGTGGGPDP
ncbi:MAG: LptA/OstA family protein [Hyphomicrobiaceae bacterium]